MSAARPLRALLHERLDFGGLSAPDDDASADRAFLPESMPIRDAAVLVPIVERAEPQILLTLRPDHLPRHAGQIAFPGGGIEPSDDGPVAAALREAREEVGLPASAIEPVGTLPRVLAPSGFRIVPVVALIDPRVRLTLDPHEVVEAFELPFAVLTDAARYTQRSVDWQGRARTYSEIDFGGRRIWGITAGILLALARALADESTSGRA